MPEPPDFVNYPFELRLARRGRSVELPAELAATEALAAADIVVDTPSAPTASAMCARLRILQAKSSTAITRLRAKERECKMILCCSRARAAGGEIVLNL